MTSISYQLYSSRNFFPVENTLNLISEHGYEEVENMTPYILTDNPADTNQAIASLQGQLADNGLTMPILHITLDHIQNRMDEVIQCAQAFESKTIVLGSLGPTILKNMPTTPEQWYDIGAMLKDTAQPILDAGLDMGYHNHHFEFIPIDGVYPIDEILRAFPQVKLQIDVAWVLVAGFDPVGVIPQYHDHIVGLHVKDKAPDGINQDQDGWCNLGEGIVPWQDVFMETKKYPNIKHFALEHDNPKSDAEFISVSTPHFKTLLAHAGY